MSQVLASDGLALALDVPEVADEVAVSAPAPVPATAMAPPAPAAAALTAADVLWSALGMVVLGAALAAGTGGIGAGTVTVALGGATIGALVLTAPAIAVAHQFLRLDTPVATVVDAVASGFVAGGRIAWGFAATGLFLAATAPSAWSLAYLALVGASGAVTLTVAARALVRLGTDPRWLLAVLGWMTLTLAIGARLGALILA